MTPYTRCRLRLLRLERIKDYLLMEEEFIRNQERLKPQEERNEVRTCLCVHYICTYQCMHPLSSNMHLNGGVLLLPQNRAMDNVRTYS